jgi:hypothetical protein
MGTLAHFVYEWSGENFIVGLFVPVNESTWEHMKLVFFPMVVYGIFMERKLSAEYCIGILSGTWLVAILFYAYSGILGFNVFVLELAVFIASVLGAFAVAYKLTVSKHFNDFRILKFLPIVLVGIMAVFFMVYSFNPPNLGIFGEP